MPSNSINKSIDDLLMPISANSGFLGVDLLLTSIWPADVWLVYLFIRTFLKRIFKGNIQIISQLANQMDQNCFRVGFRSSASLSFCWLRNPLWTLGFGLKQKINRIKNSQKSSHPIGIGPTSRRDEGRKKLRRISNELIL